MEIIWYGHSCFKLSEKNLATVVTDPYDFGHVGYDKLNLEADIVSISHDSPAHNHLTAVSGYQHIIDGPGEYEMGNVFITGVQTNNVENDGENQRNTLYVFDFDGIAVAHLGDLDRVPSQSEIEALGRVHIVLVPVGGGHGLNASKAVEVISLLEPRLVVPMHYTTSGSNVDLDPINKFLKVMGLTEIETLPSLKLGSVSSLPEETQVVILDYQRD